MTRETYEKATAEVTVFDNSDVITTSGTGGSYFCIKGFDIPGSGCQDGVHSGRVQ